jgi:hypothetical protein
MLTGRTDQGGLAAFLRLIERKAPDARADSRTLDDVAGDVHEQQVWVSCVPSRSIQRCDASRLRSDKWLPTRQHAEDGNLASDPLEFKQPCVLVYGHMGTCSGRSLKVSLEHRCALIDRDLFQSNFFATAMLDNRLPVLGPNIPNPGSLLAQHRHQISLAVQDRHH